MARLISLYIFYLLFLCYLVTSLLLWCRQEVSPIIFPLVAILMVIFFLFNCNKLGITKHNTVKGLIIAFTIIIASLIISYSIYDYSYDGQNYHQIIINTLVNGWNPYYENCPENNIWAQHYPKCLETICAVISKTFNDLETGKCVNFLFLSSLWFYLFDFFKNFQTFKKVVYSTILTFPAIVLCQLFTYYVDWFLYFLFTFGIISFANIINNKYIKNSILNLAIIAILAICTKANFAVWIFLLYCVFGGVLLFMKEYKLVMICSMVCIVSVSLGFFLLSYNPYITNILQQHHVLYPLVGEGSVDIMTCNTPNDLLNLNYFTRVVASLLSVPHNYQLIFNPTIIDFYNYSIVDARCGGFGIVFPIAFLLSLLSLVYLNIIKFKYRQLKWCNIICFLLLLSLYLLPSGWWARYVCFFSLFPMIIVFYIEQIGSHRLLKNTLIILLLFNNFLTFLSTLDHAISNRITVDTYIDKMKMYQPVIANFGDNYSFKERLIRNKIQFKEVQTKEHQLSLSGPAIFISNDYYQTSRLVNHYKLGLYNYFMKPIKEKIKKKFI